MTFNSAGKDLSEELKHRVINVANLAAGKPYISGVGHAKSSVATVWVPLLSFAAPGGIYVECLRGDGLDERELEFLTLCAAIAGAAFDRVCSIENGDIKVQPSVFHGIVGSSKQIREVQERIQIAGTNLATILIEGESGTGKELVARAIHQCGARSRGPFVPVDCGALPEGLIEAELFGAKKGAYTGAIVDRPGLFEAASGGTIFLDEISNLSLSAQAKLLRVLQDHEVRKVGSTSAKTMDVRLIAATNCSLEKLVREGKFRKDLLYRLKVLDISLPPLRDRKSDIPQLATTFLERLNLLNHTSKYLGPRMHERLLNYNYPGNIRELQNVMERAFYSSRGVVITQIDFLDDGAEHSAVGETENWFRELTDGSQNFWDAVHDPYKRRDIPRERVLALVDYGLRVTRGNYQAMATKFQIPKRHYRKFMDFLRRNRCLLDFRPYRNSDPTDS